MPYTSVTVDPICLRPDDAYCRMCLQKPNLALQPLRVRQIVCIEDGDKFTACDLQGGNDQPAGGHTADSDTASRLR